MGARVVGGSRCEVEGEGIEGVRTSSKLNDGLNSAVETLTSDQLVVCECQLFETVLTHDSY